MNSLPPFSQPSFTPPPAPQPPERKGSRLVVPIVLASLLSAGLAAGATAVVVDRGSDGAVTTVIRENVVDAVAEPAGPASGEEASVEPAVEAGQMMDAADIYRAYGSSVVRVEHSSGVGSGFVIDSDGHIVTNAHVVEGANGGLTVSFSNDEKMEAELVGLDFATDIAVLKVDAPASALKPVVLGDSARTYVGQEVVAIGNPFGRDRTVTSGIVSQVARQIPAPNGFAINGAIQTDAAINQGNSGGPLFDDSGRVIGINTQIISGGGGGSDGIGFAVPVNLAKSVVADIMEFGEAQHSWLGVRLSDVDPSLASEVNTGVDYGAMVAAVTPDSPAAKAGLRGATGEMTIAGTTYAVGGDIVISANGEKIEDVIALQQAVAALNPGDTLTLEVKRAGGATETIEVTLGNQPQEPIALGG